jgi:hypothetical protein
VSLLVPVLVEYRRIVAYIASSCSGVHQIGRDELLSFLLSLQLTSRLSADTVEKPKPRAQTTKLRAGLHGF